MFCLKFARNINHRSYSNRNTIMPKPNWTCGAKSFCWTMKPIERKDTNLVSSSNLAHAFHARKSAMTMANLSSIPMRSEDVVLWILVGVQIGFNISEEVSSTTLNSKWARNYYAYFPVCRVQMNQGWRRKELQNEARKLEQHPRVGFDEFYDFHQRYWPQELQKIETKRN